MDNFYTNFIEKDKEEKNQKIIENFHQQTKIDLNKMTTTKEEKFLFMK